MSVTPDTSKCSEGHRDGVIVEAAYTHTHTSSFPLPCKRLTHTLKLDRLLLWKARGPCDMRVGGEE